MGKRGSEREMVGERDTDEERDGKVVKGRALNFPFSKIKRAFLSFLATASLSSRFVVGIGLLALLVAFTTNQLPLLLLFVRVCIGSLRGNGIPCDFLIFRCLEGKGNALSVRLTRSLRIFSFVRIRTLAEKQSKSDD